MDASNISIYISYKTKIFQQQNFEVSSCPIFIIFVSTRAEMHLVYSGLGGRRDRMVVGFITTYAITAYMYHH